MSMTGETLGPPAASASQGSCPTKEENHRRSLRSEVASYREAHVGPITSMCFAGVTNLVTGGEDGLIRVWDWSTAGFRSIQALRAAPFPARVLCLATHAPMGLTPVLAGAGAPLEALVAAATEDGVVNVFKSGEGEGMGARELTTAAALLTPRSPLSSAADPMPWDPAHPNLHEHARITLRRETDQPTALDFSADCKWLAVSVQGGRGLAEPDPDGTGVAYLYSTADYHCAGTVGAGRGFVAARFLPFAGKAREHSLFLCDAGGRCQVRCAGDAAGETTTLELLRLNAHESEEPQPRAAAAAPEPVLRRGSSAAAAMAPNEAGPQHGAPSAPGADTAAAAAAAVHILDASIEELNEEELQLAQDQAEKDGIEVGPPTAPCLRHPACHVDTTRLAFPSSPAAQGRHAKVAVEQVTAGAPDAVPGAEGGSCHRGPRARVL